MPYVHNPESGGRFTASDLNMEMVVSAKVTLDSSEENGYRFEVQRKEMDLHAAYLVNRGQIKDTGVLFRLNYSIHQQTGIVCDTSS